MARYGTNMAATIHSRIPSAKTAFNKAKATKATTNITSNTMTPLRMYNLYAGLVSD